MKIIRVVEAKRRFSNGPLAACDAQRRAAREALMQRLQAEGVTGSRDWARDELYNDDVCRA